MSEEDFGTRRMSPPAGHAEPALPAGMEIPDQGGSPAAPVLVVARGPQAGRQITLSRSPVQLGRSSGCHVVLDDVTVSRQHAEITRDDDQYVVTDLGSLNGTYVNRSPVERTAVLKDGDELWIGIFRLVFRS